MIDETQFQLAHVCISRQWRIHWPQIEPTVKRYQEAVPLSRVLAEHHAAVAAEPLED